MPELPEVETMRRGIAAIRGSVIRHAGRMRCRCRPIQISPRMDAFRRRVVGTRITAVERLGKRVVVRLDNGHAIVFEPRMTGMVLVADSSDPRYLRFQLELDQGPWPSLWFWDRRGLGRILALSERGYGQLAQGGGLGPDALTLTATVLKTRLGRSRQAIKVALLDQRKLAGIGNLYASEILHVAELHPAQTCHRLRAADWYRLHQAIQHVLRSAIRYEGSTLSDGTYRNAINGEGRYQNHHRVYARSGRLCRSCQSGTIVRHVQAQRSTFFCPVCQPMRADRPARPAAPRSSQVGGR